MIYSNNNIDMILFISGYRRNTEKDNHLIFCGSTNSALHDFYGHIWEDFNGGVNSSNIMVGGVNIAYSERITLDELAYLSDKPDMTGTAVKYIHLPTLIYAGGYSNYTQGYDMMLYSLNKDYCTASRCPCPVLEKLEWFSVSADRSEGTCDSTDCYVTHTMELPNVISNCYNYVEYSSFLDTNSFVEPTIFRLDTFNISNLDLCIKSGINYTAIFRLLTYPESIEDCSIIKEAFCPVLQCPCPDSTDPWLDVFVGLEFGDCDSNECYVSHFLNTIYFTDFCANFMEYTVSIDSTVVEGPVMVGLDTFNISSLDRCISIGEKYEISVKIRANSIDTNYCEITKVYQCPCRCELLSNSIITLTHSDGGENCDEDKCYIEVGFDLSHNYINRCFTHFKIKAMVDDEVITETEITEPTQIQYFQPSDLDRCIEPGDDYIVTITMMQGYDDENPCVFTNSTFCNTKGEDPAILQCPDGCPDGFEFFKDKIEICPECILHVTFLAAERCGFQDLQLLSIDAKLKPADPSNCCYGMTEQEIFEKAMWGILENNKMNFEPYKSISPYCNSVTRISMSSCWATWSIRKCLDEFGGIIQKDEDELMSNPWVDEGHSSSSSSAHDFYLDTCDFCPYSCKRIVIHKPCTNTCCQIQIEVCREEDGDYYLETVTNLGPVQGPANCSHNIKYEVNPNRILDCQFSCNMLDGIFVNHSEGKIQEPHNEDTDFDESNSLDLVQLLSFKVYQDENWLNFQIVDNTDLNNYKISVFNIYGSNLDILNISSSSKENSYKLDISNYSSGTYFFSITKDGILYESGKFIIVK